MAKTEKTRLDRFLVEKGLVSSRERARALILAGKVIVNDQCVDKAGAMVTSGADVRIRGEDHPYVSRGGVKMQGALDTFGIDPAGWVVVDVGASTGGFTDCLLRRGARKVYAVDVGYGQLAWTLRNDPRVVVFERTNIRHIRGNEFDEQVDCAVIDASFISLRLVLPPVVSLLRDGGILIALVKPQFEAGRTDIGKGGVVRDPLVHERVLREAASCAEKLGFSVVGTCESPITGPSGNREFFLYAILRRPGGAV